MIRHPEMPLALNPESENKLSYTCTGVCYITSSTQGSGYQGLPNFSEKAFQGLVTDKIYDYVVAQYLL